MLLVVFVVFPLLLASPAASRAHFHSHRPSLHDQRIPLFKEAPVFRNGVNCPPSPPASCVCDAAAVHIVITLDVSYIRGSMAAILSIVQHSSCPENHVFHFLSDDREEELSEHVHSTFPYLRFQVYYFDEQLVNSRISTSIRLALEQPLNYARMYISDLLPACVKRVIYLDSDVVVVDDIAKLWGISLNSHAIGAPEYCHANFTKYFTEEFWTSVELSAVFQGRKACYFNTGVMVMDTQKWREERYREKLEEWMEVQKARRIYELGSLPPFLLVFAGELEAVEHRWNQHGLGGDNKEGKCRQLHEGPVSLLHWSGKEKPWNRLDAGMPCPIDSLWAPYDLLSPPVSHHPALGDGKKTAKHREVGG